LSARAPEDRARPGAAGGFAGYGPLREATGSGPEEDVDVKVAEVAEKAAGDFVGRELHPAGFAIVHDCAEVKIRADGSGLNDGFVSAIPDGQRDFDPDRPAGSPSDRPFGGVIGGARPGSGPVGGLNRDHPEEGSLMNPLKKRAISNGLVERSSSPPQAARAAARSKVKSRATGRILRLYFLIG